MYMSRGSMKFAVILLAWIIVIQCSLYWLKSYIKDYSFAPQKEYFWYCTIAVPKGRDYGYKTTTLNSKEKAIQDSTYYRIRYETANIKIYKSE